MRFEIGAPVSHSRRPGMHLSRDPDPCLALRTPPSSRYAIVRRALFPSGKLFKLTIVLEPFRMRFEMPEQRLWAKSSKACQGLNLKTLDPGSSAYRDDEDFGSCFEDSKSNI